MEYLTRPCGPKTQRLEAAPVPFDGHSVAWERVVDEPLVVVQEPMNGADLYRKLAAEHSDLMKGASSPFLRMYHQRIVERYLLHAEDALVTGATDRIGEAAATENFPKRAYPSAQPQLDLDEPAL
jgi:hypothetical protein